MFQYNKSPFILIFLVLIAVSFSSCDKDDDDDIVPMSVEDLSKAHITSVTIINVPPYFWDTGSSPDLQLKLALKTDTTWTYITNRVDNVEQVPQELLFMDRIDITDEEWQLELIDHDSVGADDKIYQIMFNPMNDAKDGVIPIYKNGLLVMEFNYTS